MVCFFALGIVSGAAFAQTATTKLYGTWDLVDFRKIDDVSKREVFVSGAIHGALMREYAIMSISSDGTFAIFRKGQLFTVRKGTWKLLSERGAEELELRFSWRNKVQDVKGGHLSVVKQLVERGANVDAKTVGIPEVIVHGPGVPDDATATRLPAVAALTAWSWGQKTRTTQKFFGNLVLTWLRERNLGRSGAFVDAKSTVGGQ